MNMQHWSAPRLRLWFPDEIRTADRWSLRILTLAIVQAIVGTVIVYASMQPARAPRGAVPYVTVEQVQGDRIATLEALKIPERLAVLERLMSDQVDFAKEQRDADDWRGKMQIGTMTTLVLSLIAQIVQIKTNSNRRQE